MEMGLLIAVVYIGGWITTLGILRSRVGLSWGDGMGFSDAVVNLPWVGLSLVKMWGWPVVLAWWLIVGRPESAWHIAEWSGGSPRIRRVG